GPARLHLASARIEASWEVGTSIVPEVRAMGSQAASRQPPAWPAACQVVELAERSAAMMRRGAEEFDERFTAFVRSRGEYHLRMATLLTGSPDAAEDLVQASLLKLYRAWSRIDTSGEPDAYLRRIIVNTRRSWWRARWRQETPVPEVPEAAIGE